MKHLLYKALRYSGIPFLLREISQKRKTTVLMFHDPSPETFKETILFLKKHYNIIPLSQYIKFIEGKTTLPKNSVVITLDDGHKNNYKLLGLIKEYKTPVTIFLCSEIINSNRHYWWTYKVRGYALRELKKMSELERCRIYKLQNFDQLADYGYENRQALNMEEICEMSDSGLVDFQSHTMYHVLLDKCDDTLSEKEIRCSKINLEERLNMPIYAIAYPNGMYSDREISYAKNSGYKCAVTTEPGLNSRATNPYRIKRLGVQDNSELDEIIIRTTGLWGQIKKVKRLLLPEAID